MNNTVIILKYIYTDKQGKAVYENTRPSLVHKLYTDITGAKPYTYTGDQFVISTENSDVGKLDYINYIYSHYDLHTYFLERQLNKARKEVQKLYRKASVNGIIIRMGKDKYIAHTSGEQVIATDNIQDAFIYTSNRALTIIAQLRVRMQMKQLPKQLGKPKSFKLIGVVYSYIE